MITDLSIDARIRCVWVPQLKGEKQNTTRSIATSTFTKITSQRRVFLSSLSASCRTRIYPVFEEFQRSHKFAIIHRSSLAVVVLDKDAKSRKNIFINTLPTAWADLSPFTMHRCDEAISLVPQWFQGTFFSDLKISAPQITRLHESSSWHVDCHSDIRELCSLLFQNKISSI